MKHGEAQPCIYFMNYRAGSDLTSVHLQVNSFEGLTVVLELPPAFGCMVGGPNRVLALKTWLPWLHVRFPLSVHEKKQHDVVHVHASMTE